MRCQKDKDKKYYNFYLFNHDFSNTKKLTLPKESESPGLKEKITAIPAPKEVYPTTYSSKKEDFNKNLQLLMNY
jgi:hypothetical protein